MAEKVGLIAILDMSQFNRSFAAYTRALNQMNSQTSQTASGMGGAFLSLGDSVNALATKIAVGLVAALAAATAAIGAFVASGISLAADLEMQLDGINAILGITETQGQAVKDVILELGLDPDLKATAIEAAQAVELLARNGLEVNEIIGETGDINDSAAKAVILLANAVGADFGLAADIATDAMLIFNKDADDMIDIVGGITGVVNNSKFTIQDYSLALRNGGAAAELAGVPLDEFNTLVAALAEETGRGMRAGTGLANFLTRLTPSTNAATDAMRDLGLLTGEAGNAFFDAEGNLKSMVEISSILNQALFGTQTAMVEVGGRTAEQNAQLEAANAEIADLQKSYERAQDSLRDYELGLKGVNLTEEARAKKMEEQRQIMANAQAAMQPYINSISELNSIQGDFVETTTLLTEMQRAVAVETIFGNDAAEAAIAIAKEGAPAYTDVATAMEELNLTQAQATRLVEEGTTKFELLYNEISQVDAIQQAQQRMANLKGSMEILRGVIETVQIQVGDAFIPVFTLLTEKLRDLADNVGPAVTAFFEKVGAFVGIFVSALLEGQTPLIAFTETLKEFGFGDIATQINDVVTAMQNFITPIAAFVDEHSEAFIGALQGIGVVLLAAGIAAKIVAIGTALLALNPFILVIVAAAALLGAAFETNFMGITTFVQGLVPMFQGLVPMFQAFVTNVITTFQPIVTRFETNWITIQAVVLTAWTVIQAVIQSAIAVIQPAIQTFIEGIRGGFENIGPLLTSFGALWQAIQPIVLAVLAAIGAALLIIVGVAVGAFNGIAAAVQPLIATFLIVAEGIINALTGIANFITNFVQLIIGLFQGNSDAVQEAWRGMGQALLQIVDGLVFAIIGGITGMVSTVIELIGGFVTGIIEFFTNLYDQLIDNSIITDMITDILSAIIEFGLQFLDIINNMIGNILSAFIQSVSNFVSVGKDIVNGIIQGVQSMAGALMATLQGLAQSALDAAKNFLGIESPSKVFAEIGSDITLGIIEGIQSQSGTLRETLSALFDFGSGISSFASALTKRYEDTFIKPLEITEKKLEDKQKDLINQQKGFGDQIEGLQDTIADSVGLGFFEDITQTVGGLTKDQKDELKELKSLRDEALQAGDIDKANDLIAQITRLQEIEAGAKTITVRQAKSYADLLQLARGDTPGASLEAVQAAQRLLEIYRQQSAARNMQAHIEKQIAEQQEKIRIEQEKIAAIEKQQADLKFLQQQLDFLDFIAEHGLEASDVLGGLQLGLDADLNALLQAMSGAMQSVIQAAEDELGIASPSRVFEQIAKLTWQGFTRGAEDQARQTALAMRDITRGLVSTVTNGVSNITNNNQRSRALQLEVNNSFASQPTITDRSELELILASFV